jgi:tetratricopeptide (TPR) repeat protein
MSKVFLSYDREDSTRAQAIATALEKAGHDVWWDRHIRGGSQFSKEIEEALAKAEAVVVLWSAHSVDSPWVRDEAAAGRDTGRLVPAQIDKTHPPLGFRQFQSIDLSHWTKRSRSLGELVAAVDSVASPSGKATAAPRSVHRVTIPWKWLGIAALGLSILGIGYFASTRLWPGVETPKIAVVAADSSRESSDLAADLMIKLAKLQSATANMRLIDSGKGADLTFEVRNRPGGKAARASLALLSQKDRTILWSSDFEEESGNRTNLRLQLSYTAARLLGCAMEALPARGPRLSPDLLRPYMNACAILGERYTHDVSQAIPLFKLVTEKAPKFEPAWSKLLLAETDRYLASPAEEVPSLAVQLRKHIAQARKVNPDLVEAYLAEMELAPGDAFSERARLIERALAVDPNNVYALSMRAGLYQDTGLMGAAVDDTRRAAQLDPLSPALRNFHIAALAYAGRISAAQSALAEAERLWPGATTLIDARYRLALRYGDPAEALRMQNEGLVQSGGNVRESFLRARMNPTPQNIETAIATARSIYRRTPIAIGDLIQTLGEFNREEELFEILSNWRRKDEIPFLADVLFRPPMKELWQDPRFMRIGKAMGMLDYWKASDYWPEFCADPNLPYDCKTEAAKLG